MAVMTTRTGVSTVTSFDCILTLTTELLELAKSMSASTSPNKTLVILFACPKRLLPVIETTERKIATIITW